MGSSNGERREIYGGHRFVHYAALAPTADAAMPRESCPIALPAVTQMCDASGAALNIARD